MSETKSKLDIFKESILAESRADVQKIQEDLRKERNETVARVDRELSAEAARYREAKKAEIKARESRRVSAHMTENKRTLLQYREDCASEVFAMTRARIRAFVASDRYRDHLAALLKKAIAQIDNCFAADVYLRGEDMHLADHLEKTAPGVNLGFKTGTFTMGGLRLICTAKGIRIDMSFDAAMADLVGRFSELANMQVED